MTIKWDDAPLSRSHFAESAVRTYKLAMNRRTIGHEGERRTEGILELNMTPLTTRTSCFWSARMAVGVAVVVVAGEPT